MKNILLLLALITVGIFSIMQEPIVDTIDAFAGATNDTYNVQIDDNAGPSEDEDEHEDEDDD